MYAIKLRLDAKGYEEYLEKRFKIAHRLKNKVVQYYNRQEHRRQSSDEYKALGEKQGHYAKLKEKYNETKDKAEKKALKSLISEMEKELKTEWIELNNSFNLANSKFVKYKELGQASYMYENYTKQGLIEWSTFEDIAVTVKQAYLKRRKQGKSKNFVPFTAYDNFTTMLYRKVNNNISEKGVLVGKRPNKVFFPFEFVADDEIRFTYALERHRLAFYKIKRVRDRWGRWNYWCVLTFDEAPYQHKRLHETGRVDIRIDVPYLKVYKDGDLVKEYDLNNDHGMSKRLSEYDRQLEHLRRINNPDNYNEDGTIKEGRHKWNYSNHYKKVANRRRSMWHKIGAYRKNRFGQIANEVLDLGDEFYINKKDFKKLQERRKYYNEKKEQKESTANKGKEILFNAPSELVSVFRTKLGYLDRELHEIDEA